MSARRAGRPRHPRQGRTRTSTLATRHTLAPARRGPRLATASLAVTEADFQAAVLQLAHVYHWLAYHTHDSRRSSAGFPDLVLVQGGRLIFAELKTVTGAVSPAQAAWLEALARSGRCEVYIWRPDDLAQIARLLQPD